MIFILVPFYYLPIWQLIFLIASFVIVLLAAILYPLFLVKKSAPKYQPSIFDEKGNLIMNDGEDYYFSSIKKGNDRLIFKKYDKDVASCAVVYRKNKKKKVVFYHFNFAECPVCQIQTNLYEGYEVDKIYVTDENDHYRNNKKDIYRYSSLTLWLWNTVVGGCIAIAAILLTIRASTIFYYYVPEYMVVYLTALAGALYIPLMFGIEQLVLFIVRKVGR